jgi:hypothetical protein
MTLLAGLYAILAAFLGTVVWAGITAVTGYQIGWMAIGLGALIGAGVKLGGGQGKPAALFAGGLAIVAMFLGNLMAANIALNKAITEEAKAALTQEAYQHALAEADEFVLISENEYADFIVKHEYTEAKSTRDVSREDLQMFADYSVPELRRIHTDHPDFNTWRNDAYQNMQAGIKSQVNLVQVVVEDLGVIGFLFMGMGLMAAVRAAGEWD